MKEPKIIVVDALCVVDNSFQELVAACQEATIPLYVAGKAFECLQVPERIKDVVSTTIRTDRYNAEDWLTLSEHYLTEPPHILYVSAREDCLLYLAKYGITPVAIAGARMSYFDDMFKKKLCVRQPHYHFTDMHSFVNKLANTFKEVSHHSVRDVA